jgi:hypothetical protein
MPLFLIILQRYAEFANNANYIDQHNQRYANGSETFEMEANHLADLVEILFK